jgi:hypothetical protein
MDTAAKMERLLQQEGELTDFIDNFDMNKGTALGELAAHKQVGHPSCLFVLQKAQRSWLRFCPHGGMHTPAPAVAYDDARPWRPSLRCVA